MLSVNTGGNTVSWHQRGEKSAWYMPGSGLTLFWPEEHAAHAGYLAYPALNSHVLIVRMPIYCIASRHVIIAFVPRMPCMEKQPTMPGSRLENGKFHNKRA